MKLLLVHGRSQQGKDPDTLCDTWMDSLRKGCAANNDTLPDALDIGFPFYVDSVKYSWSSTLPLGKTLSKRFGHHFVVVSESGSSKLNQWQTVHVDVRKHYARFFGSEVRPASGIALLTDADATDSAAEAYYADFRLCRWQR